MYFYGMKLNTGFPVCCLCFFRIHFLNIFDLNTVYIVLNGAQRMFILNKDLIKPNTAMIQKYRPSAFSMPFEVLTPACLSNNYCIILEKFLT